MDISKVKDNHTKIVNLLLGKKVAQALHLLETMVKQSGEGKLIDQLTHEKENYNNVLKYTFSGVKDPQKNSIYNHIRINLLEIADITKEKILAAEKASGFYAFYHKIKDNKEKFINDFES